MRVQQPLGCIGGTRSTTPHSTSLSLSAFSVTSAMPKEEHVCRVCLEPGTQDTPIIPSGCACRGPNSYAHVACHAKAATAKAPGWNKWWPVSPPRLESFTPPHMMCMYGVEYIDLASIPCALLKLASLFFFECTILGFTIYIHIATTVPCA